LQCAGTEYDGPSPYANAGLFSDVFAPWVSVASHALNPSQLQALGKAVGSDGNLWVALPDNSVQELNLNATGVLHYDASATVQKYKLKIVVNDNNPLWPDHVASYDTFCVGQALLFEADWWPSAPPITDALLHWTLPGTFVNRQPYPTTCDAYYDKDPSLLNTHYAVDGLSTTFCWYVDKVQAGKASVGINLYFSNGQTAYVNAAGLFNVYRPSFTPFTFSVQGQFGVYSGFSQDLDHFREWPYSIMGLQPPTGTPVSYTVEVDSKYPGTAEYAQIMNGYATNTVSPIDTGGIDELDTSDPYANEGPAHTSHSFNGYFATPEFQDSPWNACSISPSVTHITFTDYLQFKPDGDSANIFVTLGKITWIVDGKANETGGVWSLDSSSSVTGPTGPTDSDEFPFWLETFSVGW
jgi:hypothetical protein